MVTGYNDKTGTLTVMDPYPWARTWRPISDPILWSWTGSGPTATS